MQKKNEIAAAVGSIPTIKRKILVVGIYLPPNAKSAFVKAAMRQLSTLIMQKKTEFDNPIIIVGGDFNRHRLGDFEREFDSS